MALLIIIITISTTSLCNCKMMLEMITVAANIFLGSTHNTVSWISPGCHLANFNYVPSFLLINNLPIAVCDVSTVVLPHSV